MALATIALRLDRKSLKCPLLAFSNNSNLLRLLRGRLSPLSRQGPHQSEWGFQVREN